MNVKFKKILFSYLLGIPLALMISCTESKKNTDETPSSNGNGNNTSPTQPPTNSFGPWTQSGTSISYTDGNVGIGITSPSQKLEVSGNVNVGSQNTRTTASTDRGQLALGSSYLQTVNASVTVDWNNGNIQEVASLACDGTKVITMLNLRDGASYSLLLSGGASHSGVCIFSANGYTFKTSAGNVAPESGKDVLFTFAVINSTVVFSMMDNLY